MNPALELSVADLFCGCGGMSLGFSAAGCHIALGVDHDAVAAASYLHNFSRIQPDDPPDVRAGLEGDVGEIDFGSLLARSPDILIGGPPCQGFSRVGRAKLRALGAEAPGQDERNDLYLKFLDAAEYWKPKAVVMENVPGMLSIGGKNIALLAASDLADRGFRVGYARLNAVWYGVPQFRERFIMIGIRDDLNLAPSMPAATHRAKLPSGSVKPMAFEDWTPAFLFNKFEELPVDLNDASSGATPAEDAVWLGSSLRVRKVDANVAGPSNLKGCGGPLLAPNSPRLRNVRQNEGRR
jgi:DNA (cytosine-5)-methyltransferase 1